MRGDTIFEDAHAIRTQADAGVNKQSLRISETQTGNKGDVEAQANLMICFVIGRWHQYAKSGFKRKPMEFVQQQLSLLN